MLSNIVTTDSEPVNLYFSCKKLYDADILSKSDPFIKLFSLDQKGNQSFVGNTEVIMNNLNPDFETAIKVEYVFEAHQKFLIEVWDVDDMKTMKGDFLGKTTFVLGEILGSQYNLKVYPLDRKGKKKGRVIVRVEQENNLQKFQMGFKVNVAEVPSAGWFSTRKSFFEIRKRRITKSQRQSLAQHDGGFNVIEKEEWQLVYRSGVEEGSNIGFMTKDLKSSKICDNDFNLPLRFILMKYKKNGSHYEIGRKEFNLNRLLAGKFDFDLDMADKFKKKSTKISIYNFQKKNIYEFSDYLKGGLNLTQFVGIDFTGSNGNPLDPRSLHHIKEGRLNYYQRAILSLGEILEKYNKQNIIPCYGFGAKIDGGPTSFNFPLNLNPQAPFLHNYGQLFQAYNSIFQRISLSGPTNFAPLLREINTYTQQNMETNIMNYTIYIILTDGEITDMEDTIKEIVIGSRLALSIIIVGTILFKKTHFELHKILLSSIFFRD